MFKDVFLHDFFAVMFEESCPFCLVGYSCECVNLLSVCHLGVASGSQEISEDNPAVAVIVSRCRFSHPSQLCPGSACWWRSNSVCRARVEILAPIHVHRASCLK